jgi:tetratricopeptide (TPR) repeat protein
MSDEDQKDDSAFFLDDLVLSDDKKSANDGMWYLFKNGEQIGAFTQDELEFKIKSGEVKGNDKITMDVSMPPIDVSTIPAFSEAVAAFEVSNSAAVDPAEINLDDLSLDAGGNDSGSSSEGDPSGNSNTQSVDFGDVGLPDMDGSADSEEHLEASEDPFSAASGVEHKGIGDDDEEDFDPTVAISPFDLNNKMSEPIDTPTPEPGSVDLWHVCICKTGEQKAPCTIDEIKTDLKNGMLSFDDFVWIESFGKEWKRIGDVPNFDRREIEGMDGSPPSPDSGNQSILEESQVTEEPSDVFDENFGFGPGGEAAPAENTQMSETGFIQGDVDTDRLYEGSTDMPDIDSSVVDGTDDISEAIDLEAGSPRVSRKKQIPVKYLLIGGGVLVVLLPFFIFDFSSVGVDKLVDKDEILDNFFGKANREIVQKGVIVPKVDMEKARSEAKKKAGKLSKEEENEIAALEKDDEVVKKKAPPQNIYGNYKKLTKDDKRIAFLLKVLKADPNHEKVDTKEILKLPETKALANKTVAFYREFLVGDAKSLKKITVEFRKKLRANNRARILSTLSNGPLSQKIAGKFHELSDYHSALRWYRIGLRYSKKPEKSEIYESLGDIYAEQRKFRAAKSSYRKAIKIAPKKMVKDLKGKLAAILEAEKSTVKSNKKKYLTYRKYKAKQKLKEKKDPKSKKKKKSSKKAQ